MGGSLFIPASGGGFTKQSDTYIHVDVKAGRAYVAMDGSPTDLCTAVFQLMEAHPAFAKVFLTVVYQFMDVKQIPPAELRKHTFFEG